MPLAYLPVFLCSLVSCYFPGTCSGFPELFEFTFHKQTRLRHMFSLFLTPVFIPNPCPVFTLLNKVRVLRNKRRLLWVQVRGVILSLSTRSLFVDRGFEGVVRRDLFISRGFFREMALGVISMLIRYLHSVNGTYPLHVHSVKDGFDHIHSRLSVVDRLTGPVLFTALSVVSAGGNSHKLEWRWSKVLFTVISWWRGPLLSVSRRLHGIGRCRITRDIKPIVGHGRSLLRSW